MLLFHFMTTFYNFAVKIETSKANRVVKPISEIENANVTVYLYFIQKNFRNMQCNKA